MAMAMATIADSPAQPVADGPALELVPDPTPEEWVASLSPRSLPDLVTLEHAYSSKRYQSPLRYPGAKRGLVPVLADILTRVKNESSIPKVELLLEPFAGGASTSLRLLGTGLVERAVLADADPLVTSFWWVAAAEPKRLIARMNEEHERWVKPGGSKALERWDYWRQWKPEFGTTQATIRFETAIRCLFLNRTTFSGILHGGAGPIGGRAQTSQYDIGCRFNPISLAERIDYVGYLYSTGRIADVWCLGWRESMTLAESTYREVAPDSILAYLDPPYIKKSSQLYNRSFGTGGAQATDVWAGGMDHEILASYLRTEAPIRWLLSYDHHPDLLKSPLLYSRSRMVPEKGSGAKARTITKRLVALTYTASSSVARAATKELLLTTLPASVMNDDKLMSVKGVSKPF